MAACLRELIPAQTIRARVAELGAQISADYRDKPLILVGVLKGAFVFLADLAREIAVDARIDFVRLSSYGMKDRPQGLKFTMDVSLPIADSHLLLVEDILDTGRSMAFLQERLSGRGAASVKLCTLVDKTGRRETRVRADYAGFRVDCGFLVGYGLDYAEAHRGLPGIFELKVDGQ
ncbi:MAG: hypoxanthine phosphoribosyltransferase [Desulfovibrionaceae bacterium]|nr:hypoxanthine phosphoribosyltransferase [Desulfovibrionaceae bacterium]MBF0513931.1 hypoxanthine phosphoribosyltransferase [Desulfovibrionaceae bacterium]